MPPSGETDTLARLRATIARIESGQPASATGGRRSIRVRSGRRPASGARPSAVPLGAGAIDGLLGGGLRQGALHEVVPASPRDEGAASGFALALAVRCLAPRRTLVWIVDDCAAAENGAPYRPGLEAHGLDADRMIVVRTRGGQATLWAAEEALHVRDVVVLAELWAGRLYGLVPSRRLVLAARAGGTTGLVLHAGLPGTGRGLSSSCETRFVVAAGQSPHGRAAGGLLPVPGETAFALRLDKLRAPPRDIDHQHVHTLLWNAAQRCFHDPDLSVALASTPFDRPAPPRRAAG